jgi:hypothetical protein
MSRLERPKGSSANPATKFLNYKSEKKHFEFWNKETEKNEILEAPLKFLFLEHYHTVKGWHDPTQKGIVSNEVYAIGSEPLNIRTFGGLELGTGLYKDIKDKVKLSGGVYHRSVYVMLEDGSIANLQLKGAVVGGLSKDNSTSKLDVDGYSEFYKKNNRLLDNQWFVVNSFADAKKGATKYSIPVFELGEHLTSIDNDNADLCAKTLQEFVNERNHSKAKEEEFVAPEAEVEVDPLDY